MIASQTIWSPIIISDLILESRALLEHLPDELGVDDIFLGSPALQPVYGDLVTPPSLSQSHLLATHSLEICAKKELRTKTIQPPNIYPEGNTGGG